MTTQVHDITDLPSETTSTPTSRKVAVATIAAAALAFVAVKVVQFRKSEENDTAV